MPEVTKVNRGMFSSFRQDWRTPAAIYETLDAEFGFTFDPCPPVEGFELREDGLYASWAGQVVFLNPPYRDVGKWMQKAWHEATQATVVALVAARTDTAWWHDYALRADDIRFIRGRLRFQTPGKVSGSAPFPSAIVVFRNRADRKGRLVSA